MKRLGVIIPALVAATLLSACNNNSNNPYTTPTPGSGCAHPPYQMEVLYPKPGADHVPPTVPGVWVATTTPLPSGNQYDFLSSQSNSSSPFPTVNQSGQPVSSTGSGFFSVSSTSIPSPHANPTYPNAQYYETLFSNPIGPLVSVNLYWNDYGTNCTPNIVVSSFTTR
jgi:hypothetical protein